MKRPFVPVTVLLCSAFIATTARADYDGFGSTWLDLGRYRTDLSYPGADHEAHVGRYGIALNQALGEQGEFIVQAGYLTLDVDNEPPAAPLDFTGKYLGGGFRYEGTRGNYINLAAEITYTWHDVTANGLASAQSDVTFYETWAAVGPVLRYGPWRFSAGGYYQHFEGTETDNNPFRKVDFGATQSAGAYAGFAFYVDPTGSVGIYATTGARKGVKLIFKREF